MHILCILDLQIGFRIKPVIRLSAEINPDLFISTSISPRLTNMLTFPALFIFFFRKIRSQDGAMNI